MLALLFRYGTLLILGITLGGILGGMTSLGESLIGLVFTVLVIGGLAKLIEKFFGIKYPKFLNTPTKRRLGDMAAFLLGVAAFLGAA